MFNWILGQLRKGCGKVVCSWKSSELESAEPCEKNGKNLALNPIQCSRHSQSCVCSIGSRPIKKGYRENVYSWKSSELESAEPCEEKHQKPRPQPTSVFV